MGRIVELDHTADMSFRVYGSDLADLFATAATGMLRLMADYDECAEACSQQTIELQAPDIETLLVDWLSELLFLSEDDDCAFTNMRMTEISPVTLRATVDAVPILEHGHYVKAVTYHKMQVEQIKDEWTTTIVFDL